MKVLKLFFFKKKKSSNALRKCTFLCAAVFSFLWNRGPSRNGSSWTHPDLRNLCIRVCALWRAFTAVLLASLSEGFSRAEDSIGNEELQQVSETIYKSDSNRAEESDIQLDKQHFTSKTKNEGDQSPKPWVPHHPDLWLTYAMLEYCDSNLYITTCIQSIFLKR